jgi:sugar phosphate isomerase/epimerase
MTMARPFRLGTTSFICPDHIIPNILELGPYFDEIELLIFESRPENVLPSNHDVKQLISLSRRFNLRYNIHLPVDAGLVCESVVQRQRNVDTIFKVIELFAPLNPSTHTLHLEMPEQTQVKKHGFLEKWQENVCAGLEILVPRLSDPGIITIETLDYPFELVSSIVREFALKVCLDAGHCIKYGFSLPGIFTEHKNQIPIIHLHGVDFTVDPVRDHTGLGRLSERHMAQVESVLEDFTGIVSLEVFSLENLNNCIDFLSGIFKDIPRLKIQCR